MECSGHAEATVQAVRATRPWGKFCCVGMGAEAAFDIDKDFIRRQITLLGSWTFSNAIQADCARFCAENAVPVSNLFTHSFPLEEARAAYELFDTQTTGKAVILPN